MNLLQSGSLFVPPGKVALDPFMVFGSREHAVSHQQRRLQVRAKAIVQARRHRVVSLVSELFDSLKVRFKGRQRFRCELLQRAIRAV